jgi:hypothetical protein
MGWWEHPPRPICPPARLGGASDPFGISYHRQLIGTPRVMKSVGPVRLIPFAELVPAWGRGPGLALPYTAAYPSDVAQFSSVRVWTREGVKPKMRNEIAVESLVKGKRGSCPSPFLREPACT